jgi:spiro-SPASM protein
VLKGDSPFFDIGILDEMLEIHLKYLAEFTFSENLPEGFACEIFSRELVNQTPDTDEKTLALSEVVKANINKFDVELFYKDPDIRSKRITFRLNNKRDRKIMENIYNINKSIPAYTDVKNIIDSNPEALFIGPSYIEVELTGKCELDCLFCYRNSLSSEHEDMDSKTFSSIIESLRGFNLPYTLCLSGSGEPMEHPQIYSLMETALKENLLEQLIVETNGVKADSNFKNFISKPENQKVKVIINNNAFDKESYIRFHKKDAFETIFNNITSLAELNSGEERIYIQIMKINETDELSKEGDVKSYLDKYYNFWEKQKLPIILQKQNTYFGMIPDRRYSDLSPAKRTSCWHLQRDIYILSDGTVTFCKQYIDGKNNYGNINNSSLEEIWNRQKDSFLKDYRGELTSDCKNCDEWYTFNF